MAAQTPEQYDRQAAKCRQVFQDKTSDYGTAWRILRLPSLIDQLYIKAQRIRSIEEKQAQRVDDPIDGEFIGLVNYAVMGLVQLELGAAEQPDQQPEEALEQYNRQMEQARELMLRKNHDYGEAWRQMYISSFTDLILMKLLRMRQIVENEGRTIASEGLAANLFDIINYGLFALIKLEEKKS